MTTSSGAAHCLFCRVISGEVPSTEVLSTDEVFAFRDINPGAPTHVLVVPREHITDAGTLEPEHANTLSAVFQAAQAVAKAEGLERGYRLVFNVGEDSGNSVPHLHLHVLGGRVMRWPPG
ncbi:MAG: HIT domain-containing protein [Acidimicrobiales bacterium]